MRINRCLMIALCVLIFVGCSDSIEQDLKVEKLEIKSTDSLDIEEDPGSEYQTTGENNILVRSGIDHYTDFIVYSEDNMPKWMVNISKEAQTVLCEGFYDEEIFGIAGKFRVELTRSVTNHYFISVYKKSKGKWKIVQELEGEIESNTWMLRAEVRDFNNDGAGDLAFITGDSARGANERKTLFIFDPKKKKLVEIKGSDHNPNLRYNSKLNCIDSWAVFGGSSTTFLKILNDSLVPFASVEIYEDSLYVFEEINGKQKKLLSLRNNGKFGVYTRCLDYRPLYKLKK